MHYTLEAIGRPDFLHIRVTGVNTPAVVAAYWEEMLAACTAHQRDVVLIEENLSGPPLDVMDSFRLTSDIAESSRTIRAAAYVDTNPDHSLGLLQFAEDVAVNHGLNFRVFATLREAEQWLAAGMAQP